MIILSSILTVFCVGLSTGGLLVSRRIDPHQTLFVVVGIVFFLSSLVGMFIGSKISSFISQSAISILFGIFCLGMIGFLVWKYDPAFGYIKQEPVILSTFVVFFFILGVELAKLELSILVSFIFSLIFVSGTFLGFMFIYQILYRQRNPQFFILLPLIPLLFIGLFKLI
ncbi:hypothetical protein BKP45_09335 [Anaerobacillus alkalidiazotrophicus]|uniref:Uncharacterized protein n=1 Tax=Anaerobacillus alkalidiazotrophicus TaxID=472963 RepID=A0A1S2M6D4_9BACI|nr:hypothetical protein [Anaerobacillus alkalidiazotrophicus]OIJ20261.1 hypothetical protein BKP45_09335 [Anaerobacillus alkalidiazotrophicus]